MVQTVSVEEVSDGKALVRFTELPHALHGTDPRFTPMVMGWERARLDPRRNPFFDGGDAACFLARRLGRPVGRIAAHLSAPGAAGCFGFWWLVDDTDVAHALLEAARGWLREQGCTSMSGPWSFTAAQEAGVPAAGQDPPGRTGRPWQPPHLAALLEVEGLTVLTSRPTWRLPATEAGPELPLDPDRPGHAGAYGDERLVLRGIAAVPDVSEVLRASRLRSAWQLARRVRARTWDTCTVVRCTADPALAVPALQAAAGRAGYRWVIAPWSPDPDQVPEAIHHIYRQGL